MSAMRPLRLIVPGPYDDESISSIFDRACSLYGVARSSLAYDVLNSQGYSPSEYDYRDWDNPGSAMLRSLEVAMGLDRGALESNVIADGPCWLAANARTCYCPACFSSDLERGRSPYFRRSWSRVGITFCSIHKCPLYLWPQSHGLSFDVRRLPFEWQVPAATKPRRARTAYWNESFYPMGHPSYEYSAVGSPDMEDLTYRFMQCESNMQSRLDDLGHPLAYDHGIHTITTKLTIALSIEMTPIPTINRSLGVIRVINGRWTMAYDTEYLPNLGQPDTDPWMIFRRMASPGRRRAAYAMTAFTTEPGWPIGRFMPVAGRATTGSPDWWHHVVMPYQHESSHRQFELLRVALSIPATKKVRRRGGRPSKNTLPPQSHTWKLAKMRA